MNASILGLVLFLVGTQSVMAQASRDEVKREIALTIQDIRTELAVDLATDDELSLALRNLKLTLETLRTGGSGTVSPVQLQCLSRDNDGVGPYVLARENEDLSLTRIPEAVFSGSDCETSVSKARPQSRYLLACTSKDNDGVGPYSVIAISVSGNSTVKFGVVSSFQDCLNSLEKARVTPNAVSFCASRDNDSVGPYAKVIFNAVDGSTRMSQNIYSSLQDCYASGN